HPTVSLRGGHRCSQTCRSGYPLQTGILRGVFSTAASGGQPIGPPLDRVRDVSCGAYARGACADYSLCRGTDGPGHWAGSLCQYPACHLVADVGTPCSWGGISMDDLASALRAGSGGAPGHLRGHSPSSLAPCSVLHGGGLQTCQTCACS